MPQVDVQAPTEIDFRKPQPHSRSFLGQCGRELIHGKVIEANLPEANSPPGKAAEPESRPICDIHTIVPAKFSKGTDFEKHPVCIIGAGMAGLYTAMILKDLKIPYVILEANERVGGRIFTHRFSENEDFHDYFDVGAMRYPNTPVMERTFQLLEQLGLSGDMIHDRKNPNPIGKNGHLVPYHLSCRDANGIRYFNHVRVVGDGNGEIDPFNFGIDEKYLKFQFVKETTTTDGTPDKETLEGAEALLSWALAPFANALKKDYVTGWQKLMQFDGVPIRTYLRYMVVDPTSEEAKNASTEAPSEVMYPKNGLPPTVLNWIETVENSSNFLDKALSEAVLEDLDFAYASDIKWWSVEGGSEKITLGMLKYLESDGHKPCILRRRRVTSIFMDDATQDNPLMGVKVQGYHEFDKRRFSHVISTVPMPCLRSMDLRDAGLSSKQSEAARCLIYGPSIKLGIKFKTRWWQSRNKIFGGLSKTDLPVRTVVYPSYGLDDPEDLPGVLLASYCWTDDASRMGAFMKGNGSRQERNLLDIVYRDLAVLHDIPEGPEWLKDQTLDYYAHDFYQDENSMGAFAFYNPGQFSVLYPEITKPAAKGNLHIVGEGASTGHGWIVGALDSAWRGVFEMLCKERLDDHIHTLIEKYGIPDEMLLVDANAQVMRGIKVPEIAKGCQCDH